MCLTCQARKENQPRLTCSKLDSLPYKSFLLRINRSLTLKHSTVDVGLKIGSTHSCDGYCVGEPAGSECGWSEQSF